MSENNPDPRMQPSTEKLVHKLRHMALLQDRPERVEFVVHDLMYTFFYAEKSRPDYLWSLASKAIHLYQMTIGRDFISVPLPVQVLQPQLVAAEVSEGSSGGAPEIDLDSKSIKLGVEGVISDHIPNLLVAGEIHCSCGREYPTFREWSRHVRVRVFNYIKNIFPILGEEPTP